MPPLVDPTILGQIREVLHNWRYTGYVTAKDAVLDWIANELGETLKNVAKAMFDHLQGGGLVDQVVEQRPEWRMWPFHYDFRIAISGRAVYIETILQDDDPKDPTLHIVSIHDE